MARRHPRLGSGAGSVFVGGSAWVVVEAVVESVVAGMFTCGPWDSSTATRRLFVGRSVSGIEATRERSEGIVDGARVTMIGPALSGDPLGAR